MLIARLLSLHPLAAYRQQILFHSRYTNRDLEQKMKSKKLPLRISSTLRISFLSTLVFLNSFSPALAQDISGGADLTKDISGGAVGVLSVPRGNKQHNPRVVKSNSSVPTNASQFQATVHAVKGSVRGGGGRKVTTAHVNTPPPRTTPTAEAYNSQGDEAFDKGDYNQAIESYKQAIRLKPAYAE